MTLSERRGDVEVVKEPKVRHATPRRSRLLRAGVVLCAFAVVALPAGAGAQSRSSDEVEQDLRETEDDLRETSSDLQEVRNRLQEAEIELAQLGVDLEDARGRLITAEGQVALAEAALDDAIDVREEAGEDHKEAVAILERTEAELADAENTLALQLIESFKYGATGAQHGAMMIEVLRRAEDPNAFAVGMKQLRTVIDVQDATVTQVFELRDQRSDLADDAARARSRASQAAADAEDTLALLEELREEARAIAAQIESDEARQRQVFASLQQNEAETAALLQRVSAREDTLRGELRETRAREEAERAAAAAEAAAEEARARAAASNTGGRGGGGGGSGKPGAAGGPPIDGLMCPVQGAVAGRDFGNDWGYPRSGGRYHQGNDIFASRGTPVIAVQDGQVTRWNPPSAPTSLGGVTVSYVTADGSEWYNAHLDTVAEGVVPGASVSRGQVIGTVGNTGNARTTPPHLHIGRRYAGSWVNPWPTTAPAC